MEEYFKLKKELETAEDELNEKLAEVLDKNGYESIFAWFKFNKNVLEIIWNDTRLPKQLLDDLEEAFGRIDYLYINNPLSTKIFIKFGGEQ